jgi:hypothetical protein
MRTQRLHRASLIDALEPRRLLASWYVSPSGDDSGAGTLAQPFRTIQRGANAAFAGDTVFIRAGTYRETVTPPRSGSAGNPIVFTPFQSEQVIVSGVDAVSTWTRVGTSEVYRAPMLWNYTSDFQSNQVFAGGRMLNLTRWPVETNDDLVVNPREATIDSVVVNPSNSSQLIITDAEFVGEAPGRWINGKIWVNLSRDGADGQGQTGTVVAASSGQLTVQGIDTRLGNQPWGVGPGTRYYLFDPLRSSLNNTGGPAAALDRGEWWLDTTLGQLNVRMRDGSNPSSATVEAKRRTWAFNLDSRSHITIDGLQFFGTSITTDLLAPDRNASPGGIAPANNIVLSNIRADYVTHFTDQAGNYQMQWPQRSGFILSGSDITLRDSVLRYSAGPLLSMIGTRGKVLNNVFADGNYLVTNAGVVTFGKTFDPGPGLVVSTDHEFGFNRVYNSPGRGIDINALRNSTNNVNDIRARIHHNIIHDVLLRSFDSGAIDCVGSDGQYTRIDHNIIYNIRGGGNHGIYLDFAYKYVIDHNVVYEVNQPILLNWFAGWRGPSTPGSMDVRVFNNVALSPVSTENGIGNAFSGFNPGVVLRNNIVSRPTDPNNTWTVSNQRVASNAMFVDAAGRDYQPAATATELIDQGVSVAPFDNVIVGAAPDIGAYEFGAPAWQAGATRTTAGDLAPTALTVVGQPDGQARLNWVDNATGERGYFVERTSNFFSWQVVATLGPDATTHLDTPPAGGTWHYRVRTRDSASSEAVTVIFPRSAFQNFEAEANDLASGVFNEAGPPVRVGGFGPGSYIGFRGIDFGEAGANKLVLRLAVPDTSPGRRFDIRLDSPTGPIIGQHNPIGTGGWAIFADQTVNITNATGVRDVFIVGAGTVNGTGNIDRLRFLPVAPTQPRLTIATDTGASNTDGITRLTTPTFFGLAADGATVTLLVDSVVLGTATASAGRYLITPTSPLPEGTRSVRIEAVGGGVVGTTTSAVGTIVIDTIAPASTTRSIDINPNPLVLELGLSEAVQFTPDVALTIANRDTSALLAPSSPALVGSTVRATVAVPADGRYRATLAAGSVTDLAGNALAEPVVHDFNLLSGDATGDSIVDFADLLILAQNYGLSPKTFHEGDFNRDGTVEFADLLILAQNYGTSLVKAPAIRRSATRRRVAAETLDS